MPKPIRKNYRFSEATMRRFEHLTAQRELSENQVIEQLIKEEAERQSIVVQHREPPASFV